MSFNPSHNPPLNPRTSADDLNKSMSNMSVKTPSHSNDHSPRLKHESTTPGSPGVSIGGHHTQLNSDIQARILAFQQKRTSKLSNNIDDELNKTDPLNTHVYEKPSALDKNLPPLPSQQVRSLSSNDAETNTGNYHSNSTSNSSTQTNSNKSSSSNATILGSQSDTATQKACVSDSQLNLANKQNGDDDYSNSQTPEDEDPISDRVNPDPTLRNISSANTLGNALAMSTSNSAHSSTTNSNPNSNPTSASNSNSNSTVELSKKPSLSQRRGGLKLNINDLNNNRSPGSLSPPLNLNEDKPNMLGSTGELSRRLSERRRKPNFKLNLSETIDNHNNSVGSGRTSSVSSNSNMNDDVDKTKSNLNLTGSNDSAGKNSPGSGTTETNSPGNGNEDAQPRLQGLFANYSKYVDIKSGSLNFTGKASLHSKGIDFSSGTSFHISLDQLQFIEEIGRGNYGMVSKVLHKPTGALMAMKEVRLELDESKFTQILMELEVLHKCHSPFIVDFYGAFFVEGAVYMCMELMEGGSLDKIYEKDVGIKNERFLAHITESVIRGLKELKDNHNIIHRDVKPTNILVNGSGKVKLVDFGVSGNLVASLAKTNIGCQSYMAPERIKSLNPDDNTYSVQSDIWSLGLTILEIAKGNYPYPAETYNNIFSQLSAMVDGEPPKLDSKLFSRDAQVFVKSCLNKNPDLRPNYDTLLTHPWLTTYRDQPITEFEHYIKDRINQLELNKISSKTTSGNTNKSKENVSSILKGKVKAPALHRGGLFNNNRNFVNR